MLYGINTYFTSKYVATDMHALHMYVIFIVFTNCGKLQF